MGDKLRAKGLHDTRCRNEEVRGSGSALEDVRGGGVAALSQRQQAMNGP
jgi:hypothetical protein